jgi:hypothetical protein
MLMSSVIVNVPMYGWEGGKKGMLGARQGATNEQLILNMRPDKRAEVPF